MLISDRFDPEKESPPCFYYAPGFATWSKRRQDSVVFVSAKTEVAPTERIRIYLFLGPLAVLFTSITVWQVFIAPSPVDWGTVGLFGSLALVMSTVVGVTAHRDRQSTRRQSAIRKELAAGNLIEIRTRSTGRKYSDARPVLAYAGSESPGFEAWMKNLYSRLLWNVIEERAIRNSIDLEKYRQMLSDGTFPQLSLRLLELLDTYLRNAAGYMTDELAEELGVHVRAAVAADDETKSSSPA